eukprot:15078.XXX_812531_812707_1 [CDS] Oithona nana genome sequencing.
MSCLTLKANLDLGISSNILLDCTYCFVSQRDNAAPPTNPATPHILGIDFVYLIPLSLP